MKPQQASLPSIEHISVRPWSDFTKADYTPEQWHKACLIHLHDGPPTTKDQCKLPVRTPDGALNKNGVYAAAAALAGARGGVNAPSDKTAAARKSLRRLYEEIGAKPPASLVMMTALSTPYSAEEVKDIKHHGVKGMRWGVRRSRGGVTTAKSPKVQKGFTSSDFRKTQHLRNRKANQLTNKQLKTLNERMNLEKKYRDLNPSAFKKGHDKVSTMLKVLGTAGTAYGYLTKTQSGRNLVNKGQRMILNQRAARMASRLGHLPRP